MNNNRALRKHRTLFGQDSALLEDNLEPVLCVEPTHASAGLVCALRKAYLNPFLRSPQNLFSATP